MIDELPMYINLIFGVTTLLTVFLFYKATHNSRLTLAVISTWMIVQLFIGLSLFYKVTDTFPPRIMLLGLPPLLLIMGLFISSKGKRFIDKLDVKYLTYLHTVRIPVEFVLLWLFINGQIPQILTFEGRNFDILAGLTAPIIAYFVFNKKLFSKNVLLIWNFLTLGLLINIVVYAILTTPSLLQQFAFDQPNLAMLHFPFVWLPSCIVPIVLLSHLATIRKLLGGKS
jgi:hypothetical protein